MAYAFTQSQVIKQPKGQALLISPCNYPFLLALDSAVSALAAGCTILLKPSEFTPHTSQLIDKMAKEVFKPELFSVFLGDYKVSQELLKLPFNHIFFTGGTDVGKIIMEAASKNLSSVTLELGGMNPCIVDESAKLKDAAEKILWTKCLNAGQTCISINEIYIHESQVEKFKTELQKAAKKLYPKGFYGDQVMANIVSEKHFKRLKALKTDAEANGSSLFFGGESKEEKNWFGPTFLAHVSADSTMKNEEIFGPLVSVNSYTDIKNVYAKLSSQPVPLAAYLFSGSRSAQKQFRKNIQAGSTCINDCQIQFANDQLPFGGQNHSGIGKAHGKEGFLEFTNLKSEVKNRRGFTMAKAIYPPYHLVWKQKLVNFMIKWL
jgi:aldehyde dehydrogenase (NAD+)